MRVAVVGGGASGCIAAIMLARGGAEVTLLEKNEKIGKKLFITGKGRCNLTNACDMSEFYEHIVHGERFLRSALSGFSPEDTQEFFQELGVPLVIERGNRVFPASGKSSDVIRSIERELKRLKVDVRLNACVLNISKTEDGFDVIYTLNSGKSCCAADRVIVATGGVSYPLTGSTGDGYKFARAYGHTIVEPREALVALILRENVSSLAGLTLKHVSLTAIGENGKNISQEFGDMTFTQNGVSGPIVLTTSSYIARHSNVRLSLDLKPAIDRATVDKRLIFEFESRKNQELRNVLRALTPERLNTYVLKVAGVNGNKHANEVTKEERGRIVDALKALKFNVLKAAPFSEAVITSGGISLKELSGKCESKLCKGLYFVGEAIDVDALTGGFNLQIAFATGVAAARNILKECEQA